MRSERKIEETRRNWPFLRDRRIDAYRDLTRRFRSLTSSMAIPRRTSATACELPDARRMGAASRRPIWYGRIIVTPGRASSSRFRRRLRGWPRRSRTSSRCESWSMMRRRERGLGLRSREAVDRCRRRRMRPDRVDADSDQRLMDSRSRSDFREPHRRRCQRDGRANRARLAVQFVGREVRRRTISTTSCRGASVSVYGFEVIEPGIVLEGGSIDVNGAGVAADDRVVPAESESQSRAEPRAEIEEYLTRLSRRDERAVAGRRDRR